MTKPTNVSKKGMSDLDKIEFALERAETERAERLRALTEEAEKAKPRTVVPVLSTDKSAEDLETELAKELARMRQMRIDTQQ